MAKSRLPKRTKNKHVDKNVWKHIPYKKNDPNVPYDIGQILHVYPKDTDADFVPCMPKPGSDNAITRLPYQTKVTFLGMVEFLGNSQLMHFLVGDKGDELHGEVFVGLGAAPHLCNIPKRPTKGLNATPKRKHPPGSGRGGKKSPLRLARIQAKKRRDAKRLKNKE